MKKLLNILLCSFMPLAYSQSAGDELQTKLNSIHTMSANFSQKVMAGKREISQSTGNMALARPGKFRWQTNKPLQQLIIADGKQLWIYDTDLEQVTVKKQQKGLGGTPALFLSDYDNTVTRDFQVKTLSSGKQTVYQLTAKSPKENYQQLKLTFSGASLSSIEFFDQLGQHTVIVLTNIKNNASLSSKLFHFTPPKGTDVIKQ